MVMKMILMIELPVMMTLVIAMLVMKVLLIALLVMKVLVIAMMGDDDPWSDPFDCKTGDDSSGDCNAGAIGSGNCITWYDSSVDCNAGSEGSGDPNVVYKGTGNDMMMATKRLVIVMDVQMMESIV